VAADLLYRLRPKTTVWLSTPTWPNHPQVFAAAGLQTRAYAYLHPATGSLDLAGLLGSLVDASPDDVVVLHGCCHNPSGVDPSAEQWAQLAAVIAERRLLPLVDFAYQGFGDGLREDAAGMLTIADTSPEFLVASSFSKNFALYAERVGALSIVGADRTGVGGADEPRQGGRPNALFQPASAWRRGRGHCPARCRPAGALGR
jgi:aspartate/tyrosine/aromatic aminotransferase